MTEFNCEQIKYTFNSKCIDLSYNSSKISLQAKGINVPFGLEKNFNNYLLKIILNQESKGLFETIKRLEESNIDFLNKHNLLSNSDYKSQIIQKSNYGEFLVVKIPLIKNQFMVDITDKDSNIIDVFKIQKKEIMDIHLEMNSIWSFKNKYSCVPKVTKIKLH